MAARRRHTARDLSSIQMSRDGIRKLKERVEKTGESYEGYIRRRLRL